MAIRPRPACDGFKNQASASEIHPVSHIRIPVDRPEAHLTIKLGRTNLRSEMKRLEPAACGRDDAPDKRTPDP
jgi:hypothetical protein